MQTGPYIQATSCEYRTGTVALKTLVYTRYGRYRRGVNHLFTVFLSVIKGQLRLYWPTLAQGPGLLLIAPLIFLCASALPTFANGKDGGDIDKKLRLMVFGDSLVAGHGLAHGEAFPDILRAELAAVGHNVEMVNAGVSGDTTAGGLARLDWSLAENPDALIIVLGGNDLLRGLEPKSTKANLAAIIDRARSQKITVMLTGMQAPLNFGADYAAEFDIIYTQLGSRDEVIFYPFFLEGVALVPELNQPDGMHPNRAGVDEIVRRIRPTVEKLLATVPNH